MVEEARRLKSSLGPSEAGLEVQVQMCLFPGCAGQRRVTCSPSLSLFVSFVMQNLPRLGCRGRGWSLGGSAVKSAEGCPPGLNSASERTPRVASSLPRPRRAASLVWVVILSRRTDAHPEKGCSPRAEPGHELVCLPAEGKCLPVVSEHIPS